MEWISIINIIIVVLTAVLQMIGGAGSNTGSSLLNSIGSGRSSFSCESAYWVEPPFVRDGYFEGKVAVDCEADGLSGGGLAELGTFLRSETLASSKQVFNVNSSGEFEGLPSQHIEHSILVGSDHEFEIDGETDVASDDYSMLRSVFQSVQIPAIGAAAYLEGFNDEIEVISAGEDSNHYFVRVLSSSHVRKPALVSDKNFKQKMVYEKAKGIEERSGRILSEISSHL